MWLIGDVEVYVSVLIFIAYKRLSKKEERDQEQLREEGRKAQAEERRKLDQQKQNRNAKWAGIGGSTG